MFSQTAVQRMKVCTHWYVLLPEEQEELDVLAVLQNTLDAVKRALLLVQETEQTAANAAEALYNQRQQLQSVETNLDRITDSTASTSRVLRQIKSPLGERFNNLFSGKPKSGGQNQKEVKKGSKGIFGQGSSIFDNDRTLPSDTERQLRGVKVWAEINTEIEDNFALLRDRLMKLRMVAEGLQGEFIDQNELLDRTKTKTEQNMEEIRRQDKELREILNTFVVV